jgi:hypothetical protein
MWTVFSRSRGASARQSASAAGATLSEARALRLPAAAALFGAALLSWRLGMDGAGAQAMLAHTGFCLGGGAAPSVLAAAAFGHCAACYGAACAGAAGLVAALWPMR